METYIVNNLTIKAEQMTQDFELKNEDGTFQGSSGDYIILENGKQKGCKRSDFEQTYTKANNSESSMEQFRRLMEQGYQEMAELNLKIAHEEFQLEEEAHLKLESHNKITY
ncbi:hypothetical protein [Brevibacillus sp. NRS-1366]|uniref:hypothetical protein n=1 Tax=Brevibacillus sp. NRS-1366 TaxID=3233899 RepID=UPI003D23A449